MQNALADAQAANDIAIRQAQTAALEQERIANVELRDKLERSATEFSLTEERYKSEIADLRARLEREQTTAKNSQSEMMLEINVSP